jgi:hypothetical protein
VMIMISGVKTNRVRQHSLALCATLENAYHIISLLTIDDRRHRPSRALSQGPMLHVNLSFFGMRDRTTTTRHVERSWGDVTYQIDRTLSQGLPLSVSRCCLPSRMPSSQGFARPEAMSSLNQATILCAPPSAPWSGRETKTSQSRGI